MARASREGLEQLQPNARPFLLTRSGYAGVQKYAWSWTGDNNSTFTDLKSSMAMLLNMSLSGQVMIGADVGGFTGDCTPELYARWIALGALCYPFFRSHSMKDTLEQNAWAFGAECEQACQCFIKLRYRLIPYIYTQVQLSTNKDKAYQPLLRPLWLEFPQDEKSYEEEFENTQLFLGSSIMVAPILEKEATSRMVYLPPHPGGWFDFFDKSIHYEGGCVVEITNITLNKSIVFVKSGSIIPLRQESKQSTYDNLTSPIVYEIFRSSSQASSSGYLYLDDGFSNDHKKGKYGLYQLSLGEENDSVELNLIEGEGFSTQLSQEQVDLKYFSPFSAQLL